MKLRRNRKIKVSAPLRAPLGAWLQFDVGENAEMTQLLASRGTTIKVGRVRWYHRAWWWLQALPVATGRALRRGLCALRGHPLDGYHCKCGERERPDLADDWAEDLYDDDLLGSWPGGEENE